MITVKDIREKEFGKQKHGYHEDEVDDFLDEIADQMEELIRENRSLLTQLDDARSAAAAAAAAAASLPVHVTEVAPAPAPEPVPVHNVKAETPVDEPSYFRNLETTLRETLLSAQRIADTTVAEARDKAKDLVTGAEEQAKQLLNGAHDKANKVISDANAEAASAKTELEIFKKQHEDYKSRVTRMLKEQAAALKIDEEEIVEKVTPSKNPSKAEPVEKAEPHAKAERHTAHHVADDAPSLKS